MRKIMLMLYIAAGIGLLTAISLADNIHPTGRELFSSVVILIMAIVMLMAATDIKHKLSKNIENGKSKE